MKIAYCICTNSHLAFAKVLGDSLKQHNSDYSFIVFLVDELEESIVTNFDYKIVLVKDVNIPEWQLMNNNYTPFELCCALKPFFAEYIINTTTNFIDIIIYFDTDILILNSLKVIEESIKSADLIFTPHFLKDEKVSFDSELFLLRTGYLNGGFFALNTSENARNFLSWWKERLVKHGYDKSGLGMFVDQLWLNLVPMTFDRAIILKSKILNVAQWNYKFRKLYFNSDVYIFQNGEEIVFYHFSDYKYINKDNFIYNQNIINDPIITDLYNHYNEMISIEKEKIRVNNDCIYGTKKFIKRNKNYKNLKYLLIEHTTSFLRKL